MMHRKIARNPESQGHFTVRTQKQRKFFSHCSLNDYWREFAGTRLDYGSFLESVIRVIGTERMCVIRQERLATDPTTHMVRLFHFLGMENNEVRFFKKMVGKTKASLSKIDIPMSIQSSIDKYEERLEGVVHRLKHF
jgi:hypothetical protein